jgi:hypothetical protein
VATVATSGDQVGSCPYCQREAAKNEPTGDLLFRAAGIISFPNGKASPPLNSQLSYLNSLQAFVKVTNKSDSCILFFINFNKNFRFTY